MKKIAGPLNLKGFATPESAMRKAKELKRKSHCIWDEFHVMEVWDVKAAEQIDFIPWNGLVIQRKYVPDGGAVSRCIDYLLPHGVVAEFNGCTGQWEVYR